MEPIKTCPICGSRKVERVRDTVHFPTHAGSVAVPVVEFDRCGNCGEAFFDHAASAKIDAAMAVAKRRHGRRKSA